MSFWIIFNNLKKKKTAASVPYKVRLQSTGEVKAGNKKKVDGFYSLKR